MRGVQNGNVVRTESGSHAAKEERALQAVNIEKLLREQTEKFENV